MSERDLIVCHMLERAIQADRQKAILPRVKVVGPNSANGRQYLVSCLKEAVSLYEGAPVNLDHPAGHGSVSVLDRFGWLEACRLEGDSIYADLHYNPKHIFAETFVWWAANQPLKIGLSHNAIGTGKERTDGVFEVSKIIRVRSVDLVADPATVKGLYESRRDKSVSEQISNDAGNNGSASGEAALPEAIRKELDELRAKVRVQEQQQSALAEQERKELDELRAKARLKEQREKALALCREAGLPETALSDYFLEHLAGQKDETAMKAAIEDRRRILGIKTPVSAAPGAGQGSGQKATDLKSFDEQLYKGTGLK